MLSPINLHLLRLINGTSTAPEPEIPKDQGVASCDTCAKPITYSLVLDIETLSRQDNAVVTSIGAIAFDRETFEILGYFEEMPNIFDQLALHRHVCPETIAFHRKHGTLPEYMGLPTPAESWARLAAFIGRHRPKRIWIQGKDFDLRILKNLAEQINAPLPWEYWMPACARDHWASAFPGVKHAPRPHRAVEDCEHTLRDLRASLEKLNALGSA